jgi:ketose-bisphosphate aldolase
MPLVQVMDLVEKARKGGYAVGYFESWNLESLFGVVDAAEKTRSPIIIGFNGEFLTRPGRLTEERISIYGALARAAAEQAAVPCGILFNECAREADIYIAIEAGFSQVMLDDPDAEREEAKRRIAQLVKYAHRYGVSVEAEVGELPTGESGKEDGRAVATDPEDAARFVETTGVDIISISVGNVHILVNGKKDLDMDRIAAIRDRVDIPLDLHGGTGIPVESLKRAIELGVSKVCFGTYLKQRFLSAARDTLQNEELNPHKLLGMGGREDMLAACRIAVRDAVLERIEVLGCCGKI